MSDDTTAERKISEAINTWCSANYTAGVRLRKQERDDLARFIARRVRRPTDERPTP